MAAAIAPMFFLAGISTARADIPPPDGYVGGKEKQTVSGCQDVKLLIRPSPAIDVTGLMSGSRTAYLLEMVRQCLLRELTQMAAAAPGGLGWTHGAVQVQARRCPGGCDPAAAGVAVELGLGHAWWSTGAGARRFLMHRLTRSPPDRQAGIRPP